MEVEKIVEIWKPISFTEKWLNSDTSKLDELSPSWYRKRSEFKEGNLEYEEFIERLKRQHAIETGVVERLYDLKEGITRHSLKKDLLNQ